MSSGFRRDKQPLLPTHDKSAGSGPHRFGHPRISFPPSSTSALGQPSPRDTPDRDNAGGIDEDGDGYYGGAAATGGMIARGVAVSERLPEQKREGLPKLSRECLWSEIKCYGSYILPVLLVFGVLVIGSSLIAVGWKKGWFDHE